jgi:hypothetical protein
MCPLLFFLEFICCVVQKRTLLEAKDPQGWEFRRDSTCYCLCELTDVIDGSVK